MIQISIQQQEVLHDWKSKFNVASRETENSDTTYEKLIMDSIFKVLDEEGIDFDSTVMIEFTDYSIDLYLFGMLVNNRRELQCAMDIEID